MKQLTKEQLEDIEALTEHILAELYDDKHKMDLSKVVLVGDRYKIATEHYTIEIFKYN